MMSQEIKDILSKPAEEVTSEEKEKLEAASKNFTSDIIEVCKKHGFQHAAVLKYTPTAVLPTFQVIPMPEEEESKSE